jgi:hypothetical protein
MPSGQQASAMRVVTDASGDNELTARGNAPTSVAVTDLLARSPGSGVETGSTLNPRFAINYKGIPSFVAPAK